MPSHSRNPIITFVTFELLHKDLQQVDLPTLFPTGKVEKFYHIHVLFASRQHFACYDAHCILNLRPNRPLPLGAVR